MTPDTNGNVNKPAEAGDAVSPGNTPVCGPGCGCGKPTRAGGKNIRIGVCLAVIVAVCGILLYKTTNARQNINSGGHAGFATPAAGTSVGVTAGDSGQHSGTGTLIPSLSTLDTVAIKQDSVFLIVPGKDNSRPTRDTMAALAAAEKQLLAKGIRIGLYTLQTGSPDYPGLAAKVSAPNVAVLTKGKGIGVVSGPISEANLIQAYVASTRGGGCCPPAGGSGADASSAPCN